MTISRVTRSPMGAVIRSPLGVRGDTSYRVILIDRRGFGLGLQFEMPPELAAQVNPRVNQQPYKDLAKKLKAPFRFVHLVFENWMPRLTAPLVSKRKRVHNLVFILGGGNPTNFRYFKNYTYRPGFEIPVGSGSEAPYRTGSKLAFGPDGAAIDSNVAENGIPQSRAQLRVFRDATPVVAGTTEVWNDPASNVLCSAFNTPANGMKLRDWVYKTNYSPSFDDVKNDLFDQDLAGFQSKVTDFGKCKTSFFIDPLVQPSGFSGSPILYSIRRTAAETKSDGLFLNALGIHTRATESGLDYWDAFLRFWNTSVAGGFMAVYTSLYYDISPGGGLAAPSAPTMTVRFWTVTRDLTWNTFGYQCSEATEDGGLRILREEHTTHGGVRESDISSVLRPTGIDWPLVSTQFTTVATEGVDQSVDNTATTESLFRHLVDNYGPTENRYRWKYSGQVNGTTLDVKDILSRI